MDATYYNTDVMLEAIKTGVQATSFLTKRYFPESARSEFITKDVLIEYKNGNQKAAPFVVPHVGGVPVERKGYTTKRYEPANIEPSKVLKIEDLEEKGFGEAIYANETPEDREQLLLAEDLVELDEMITRRQEIMAASVMLNNKIEMTYKLPDGTTDTKEIRYYDELANPFAYSITTKWDQNGATIIDDIFAMCEMATEKGVDPQDLIVTPAAMAAIRNDAKVLALLDNKRYNLGEINPVDLGDGAKLLGTLNADGFVLNLIQYNAKYEADNGTMTPFIPDGYVIVAAPASGQTVYGAVSQKEQADGKTHTYAGRRVPKYTVDIEGDQSKIKLSSKPLLAPQKLGGWISACAVTV